MKQTIMIQYIIFKIYFENNTVKKDFNDFETGQRLFRKIKSGKMKLEDAKEL